MPRFSSSSALTACEAVTGEKPADWRTVWLKGGFPDALRGQFRGWWEAYLRLFLERDLPQYGVPADRSSSRSLLTMLAHSQGGLLNASQIGASLGVSYHTVQRYLDRSGADVPDAAASALLPQRWQALGQGAEDLLARYGIAASFAEHLDARSASGTPIRGASWETFVIEDALRREQLAHPGSQPFFWRTAAGAEIDLLIERSAHRIGVEVKTARGDDPRAVRALSEALVDVDAFRGWIIDQDAGVEPAGGSRRAGRIRGSANRDARDSRRFIESPRRRAAGGIRESTNQGSWPSSG